MAQVTVTIGRNIGSEPMDSLTWRAFQNMIGLAVWENTSGTDRWAETHYGTGQWEGVREESAKITVHFTTRIDREALHARLRAVADTYRQDVVALSIADSELV